VLLFMLDMKLSELKIPTTSNITVPGCFLAHFIFNILKI
jgi:hypothetical protein